MSGRILAVFLAMLLMTIAGAAEPTRVVQAEEILKKIELGQPVEYDNVIVEGDLDLSGLNLTRVYAKRIWLEEYLPDYQFVMVSPLMITNSVIMGSANLNGTTFQNAIIFQGTRFEGPAFLKHSRFNQIANFADVKFHQTADFNNTQFSRAAYFGNAEFNKGAYFWDAQFNQTAYFVYAQFNQSADFWNAQFNQTANFSSVQFNQGVNFNYVQFNQTASFGYAKSNQTAVFESTKFNKNADFRHMQFNQTAYFAIVQFNKDADFRYVQFNKDADFGHVQFNKGADFEHAQFKLIADFIGTQFNQTAYFWNTQFNQTADFMIAQFNKGADFTDSQFNQTAKFWNAQFSQTTTFSGALFDQEAQFWNAHFQDLRLDRVQFSKEVFFDDALINGTLYSYRTKYEKLNIRWSAIHDIACDDTGYYLLIENFKKQGFTEDANECYYAYRFYHMSELLFRGKYTSWLFDFLAYATYGYGLRPVRPLGWAALFIFIGGVFFFLTGSVARSKETPSGKKPLALRRKEEKPEGIVSIWESLLLSATYFTSGASSIISATPTEFVPVGRGRYVVVILRLLGWIFFVLFLSSLTRTV